MKGCVVNDVSNILLVCKSLFVYVSEFDFILFKCIKNL